MGEVIRMTTSQRMPTKTISDREGDHRYTCTFDPNAPPHERWVWYVDYVRTYRYVGSSPTMEKAVKDARRKIHSLNTHEVDEAT